jgi:hypothetical protein
LPYRACCKFLSLSQKTYKLLNKHHQGGKRKEASESYNLNGRIVWPENYNSAKLLLKQFEQYFKTTCVLNESLFPLLKKSI